MATNGKLEKMLILAFKSSEDAELGGKAEDSFEALINPETYALESMTANDSWHYFCCLRKTAMISSWSGQNFLSIS